MPAARSLTVSCSNSGDVRADEGGVAGHDIALAQPAQRTVGDLGVDRAERAPERDELAITEAAVCAEEAGRELARLDEQAPPDRVGVGAAGLRPSQHHRLEAFDELADGPGQDVVAHLLVHHSGIIVARVGQT